MAENGVWVWDFTIDEKEITQEKLIEQLRKYCKKWTFQLEKGVKTGYLHWQGRVSLKVKNRKGPQICKHVRWSMTSGASKDDDFYVTKEDTRVEGPWSSNDVEIFIPINYRNLTLREWQIIVLNTKPESRIINLIYDPIGNKGKSTVAAIGELLFGGIDMPPVNDAEKLIETLCNILMDTRNRDPKLLFLDLPRAIDKERLYGLYTALEQIKKGKVYDFRYRYKSWWFNPPTIWVFSNHLPDPNILSADRWKIWKIEDNYSLKEIFFGGKPVIIQKKLL